MWGSIDDRTLCPLSSAITSWNRGKFRVRHAAAVFEAFDDVVFDVAEQRDVLGEDGEVVGAGGARQKRRVLRRQMVTRLPGSTITTFDVTIAPSHSRT